MARPKSEDRRGALLEAAIKVFAEHGLAAPTSLVSKTAKVSEGSLFTYFESKDELVNAVYRELRLDLAAAIANDFPRKGNVRDRFEHVWRRYVGWGVDNPVGKRALRVASMSKVIRSEVRAASGVLFAEIDRLHADALEQRLLADVPKVMVSQALKALAEMTMDLVAEHPSQKNALVAAGFGMLWRALARKPGGRSLHLK
jgi:AcrR family transcriptional regulator